MRASAAGNGGGCPVRGGAARGGRRAALRGADARMVSTPPMGAGQVAAPGEDD